MASRATRIVVAITVHDRRDVTLRCLRALDAQVLRDASLDVVVFDDGSSDGTAAAIAAAHPDVQIIPGDGSFFWNGGMRVALSAAMASDPDFLLWLNDDTALLPMAVQHLHDVHADLLAQGRSHPIVVGAVVDPDDGSVNYSGRDQDRRRPMAFPLVGPAAVPVRVRTMNGNFVLVPRGAYERLGNLDPGFTHSMGDYDYGLRASRDGIGVWLAPQVLATCPSNPGFVPTSAGLREEFRRLKGTRHLPPDEWLRFVRRWGGPIWPVFWASPYLRRAWWIVRAQVRRRPS